MTPIATTGWRLQIQLSQGLAHLFPDVNHNLLVFRIVESVHCLDGIQHQKSEDKPSDQNEDADDGCNKIVMYVR